MVEPSAESDFEPEAADCELVVVNDVSSFTVPAIVAQTSDNASEHFLEFFAATIRNPNTRLAYMRAVRSFLDWRGVVVAFVWKQTPVVALMVAGAMASLDRGTIEAARNLGASRLRILVEIVVPQVTTTLLVGLVLSFVTMMGVLSVPLMINAQAPTMITADIAFRLSTYRDYGVANALGLISLAISAVAAWFYLRVNMRQGR